MTVAQIITALGGVPNPQTEVRDVWTTAPGDPNGVVSVTFADGSIDSFDENGKPVIET